MEAEVRHSEAHIISFCPYIITCMCSLQSVIGLVCGALFFYSFWYTIDTELSLRFLLGIPLLSCLMDIQQVLSWLVYPISKQQGVGQVLILYVLGVTLAKPTLQGQLYCVAWVRYRGHSAKYHSWWEAGPALWLLWPQWQISHLPQAARGPGAFSPLPMPPYSRWGE